MDQADPKGLVREAYRIEGIGPAECRSIFLDWALGVAEPGPAVRSLLDRYGAENPDHPMTVVLRESQGTVPRTGRRGGWRARR